MKLVLTCDDFISAGLIKSGRCCPYCHEDESLLFSNETVLYPPFANRNDVSAVLCCIVKIAAEGLSRGDWAKVLQSRRKLLKKCTK